MKGMDALMKLLTLALGTYNALFWRILATLLIAGVAYALHRPARPAARRCGSMRCAAPSRR
ncbi:MAG: hypothetical protein WDN44_02840 [Sphingomonas sp.]